MSHKQQVKHTVEKQNNDTHQSHEVNYKTFTIECYKMLQDNQSIYAINTLNEKTDKETIKREFFKCLHNVHQKYIDK
jgi:hypothetical protein